MRPSFDVFGVCVHCSSSGRYLSGSIAGFGRMYDNGRFNDVYVDRTGSVDSNCGYGAFG